MKSRSQPSNYPTVPFHAIRFLSFLSTLIVSAVLIYFSYQLKADGFKIPWTLLIVLIASLGNFVLILFTSILHCCGNLSPLFNFIVNIPVLLVWLFAMSLLAYNMYGTLAHSCTIDNWGNDDGVMVCQAYKALFSFVVLAVLAHIAQLVLDVRARRAQTRLGKYNVMRGSHEFLNNKDGSSSQVWDSNLHEPVVSGAIPTPGQHGHSAVGANGFNRSGEHMSGDGNLDQFRDETPGWRPRAAQSDYEDTPYTDHYAQQQQQQNQHFHQGQSYQMEDFSSTAATTATSYQPQHSQNPIPRAHSPYQSHHYQAQPYTPQQQEQEYLYQQQQQQQSQHYPAAYSSPYHTGYESRSQMYNNNSGHSNSGADYFGQSPHPRFRD